MTIIANTSDKIRMMKDDRELQGKVRALYSDFGRYQYSYNFSWLGRPIIQLPQDVVTMQEIIWEVQPDIIIETGIAHGGSLIFSASMLCQLDLFDAYKLNEMYSLNTPKRTVVGIDIDIRDHNRLAIEEHPLNSYIKMIEGSSTDREVFSKVREIAKSKETILVCLDSMHTHEHVLRELELYSSLVTPGSYCVVFDSIIEDMSMKDFNDRPWKPGNSPKTAIWEFLKRHDEFEIDSKIEDKMLITASPDGFLRKKL